MTFLAGSSTLARGLSVAFRRAYLVLGAASTAAIVLLAYDAPITYDEAFSRLNYGRFGVRQILTTYDFPNNHLPFTVLQSFIPLSLLHRDPWLLRTIAVVFGIATVIAALVVTSRRMTSPVPLVFAIAGSPILVEYLFAARAYTFSSLWLGLAAALPPLLRDRRPYLGIVAGAGALAVGTWPLPIYVFAAPGWVLAVAFVVGVRRAALGAAVYAAALSAMYIPIAGQIRRQSHTAWAGHERWWSWLGDVFVAANAVPVAFAALLIVLLAATVVAVRSHGRSAMRVQLFRSRALGIASIAFATSVGWFALVGIAYGVGVDSLPFVRTTVPALWLLLLAFAAAVPRGRLEYAVAALLMPGAVVGAVLWVGAVQDGNWKRLAHAARNDAFYYSTPVTIRDVGSVADRIACSSLDQPVCQLETPHLAAHGVRVDLPPLVVYDPALRCALGSRRPPPPWQISIFRNGRLVGVLCN